MDTMIPDNQLKLQDFTINQLIVNVQFFILTTFLHSKTYTD